MAISIKNIVLGLAILILTIIVGITGILTLYGNGPQFDNFCSNRPMQPIETQQQCVDVGGQWQFYDTISGVKAVPSVDGTVANGWCDFYYECNKKLNEASKSYHKKVFLTALPLGVIVIIIGAIIFGLEAVGAGLMLGGIGIIFFGVTGYWQFTENWMKFALSLFGLVVVIWLTYYWNNRIERLLKKKRK